MKVTLFLLFSACDSEADIALVFDCSGSITNAHFKEMIDTAKNFTQSLDISLNKVHMAAFAFNDHISKRRIFFKPFKSGNNFRHELDKYKSEHTSGGTRTDRALKFLYQQIFKAQNGDRQKVPNIVVLFTDGMSNKPDKTKTQAQILKQDTGAHIIVVGIGNKIDINELEIIATNKRSVIQAKFDHLTEIIEPLIDIACNGK